MKPGLVIVAIALPLAAALLVLVDSPRRDAPVRQLGSEPAGERALPSWVEKPIPYVAPIDLELDAPGTDGGRIPGLNAAIEAEMRALQVSLDQDFRSMLVSPSGISGVQSAEYEQYMTDPDWPTVAAVPGVSGFAIRVCPSFMRCLSDRLGDERDEPNWARPMEARLYAEVARHAGNGLSQLHVVCRETICGVLMPAVAGVDRQNLFQLGTRLTDELKFSRHAIADRADFQAIYFENGNEDLAAQFFQ
jgi:hypothetical protein